MKLRLHKDLQDFNIELQKLFYKYHNIPLYQISFVLNKELFNIYRTAEERIKLKDKNTISG